MKECQAAENARIESLKRADELKKDAAVYLEAARHIPTGIEARENIEKRRRQILEVLNGSEEDWQDWTWHMRNRVKDAGILAQILGLSEMETRAVENVGNIYRWAISPYYLSLIGYDYRNSPIFKQAVPDTRELANDGDLDPMGEASTSPAECVTRRYPDRLIINVTNQCAMFCRHCQRRRNIGQADRHARRQDIAKALNYVAENPEIRDVLITGGDALLLSDKMLDWILGVLHSIPHVEIKRIGTRVPVTLPQRITPELCAILRRYPPVYINTQFNHPLEVTEEARAACDRLAESGVVLGNQAVLLKGINDDPWVMRKLNQALLRIRVKPYYIFQAKEVRGTMHWRTSLQKGLEIIEALRGHTSGMAVPTFVVNACWGLGKIPVMPNYVVELNERKAVLRTWEGRLVEVDNPHD